MLPAANLRGPPDKYGLLTIGRPSVRCYSTLRAWSPLCGSTLRISQAARQRWLLDYFFHFFRMLRYEQLFFGDAELFSPPLIGQFLKDSFSDETIFQEHERFFLAFFTSKMISVPPCGGRSDGSIGKIYIYRLYNIVRTQEFIAVLRCSVLWLDPLYTQYKHLHWPH